MSVFQNEPCEFVVFDLCLEIVRWETLTPSFRLLKLLGPRKKESRGTRNVVFVLLNLRGGWVESTWRSLSADAHCQIYTITLPTRDPFQMMQTQIQKKCPFLRGLASVPFGLLFSACAHEQTECLFPHYFLVFGRLVWDNYFRERRELPWQLGLLKSCLLTTWPFQRSNISTVVPALFFIRKRQKDHVLVPTMSYLSWRALVLSSSSWAWDSSSSSNTPPPPFFLLTLARPWLTCPGGCWSWARATAQVPPSPPPYLPYISNTFTYFSWRVLVLSSSSWARDSSSCSSPSRSSASLATWKWYIEKIEN